MDRLEKFTYQQLQGFIHTPDLFVRPVHEEITLFKCPIVEGRDTADYPNIDRRLVLGKRLERIFSYVIQRDSDYEIVLENHQIRTAHATLGEMDFILNESNNNQLIHIELVYKFYLYDPTQPGEVEKKWIGPNRKDSLYLKMQKLLKRQFPLLYRKETGEALTTMNLSADRIKQALCFKARLFIPYSIESPLPQDPTNPACISGYWMKYSEFTPQAFTHAFYSLPEKKDWPIDPKYAMQWTTFAQIKPQIDQLIKNCRSPMVWIKTTDNQYIRLFLVWW
jgi:hypothetical protein